MALTQFVRFLDILHDPAFDINSFRCRFALLSIRLCISLCHIEGNRSMQHFKGLISNGIKLAPDTLISLPVARDYGIYPGILYPYLQQKQKEQLHYADSANVRMGIQWIPSLAASEIVQEVPALPDAQTVIRAADTLEAAGVILTERTGAFMPPNRKTNRKRDIATWWCVSRKWVARRIPAAYCDDRERYIISSMELAAYGPAEALILAHWRRSPMSLAGWKKLSATEMAKVLPMDERTIRRHLKALVNDGVLVQHAERPKFYALAGAPGRVALNVGQRSLLLSEEALFY